MIETGEILNISDDFGHTSPEIPQDKRKFQEKRGGGSLLDSSNKKEANCLSRKVKISRV